VASTLAHYSPGLYTSPSAINSCTSTIVLIIYRSNVPICIRSFPIALRKGKHSCTTQHPISQFVFISSLSLSFSCFISHLSSVSIPKTVQDALSNFGWSAMELKMATLHQNGTLVPLPPVSKLLAANGFTLLSLLAANGFTLLSLILMV
jgi:hypothetical protein